MTTPHQQLDALRSLPENWDGYGAAAPALATIELAREFAGLLEAALARSKGSSVALQVSPTRVGGVLIEWEDTIREHEVEIGPDQGVSFLHMEKTTGRMFVNSG